MAFDINSAKPAAVATARPKFDIASAKPVEPSTWEKIKSGVGKVNDFVGDNIIQPVAGAGEIALTAASGIVGDTAGNISGLAAIPLHAAGVIDTEPQAVKDAVSGAVTYQPRTEGAQAALRTIAKPFEMLEESKQRTADIAGEASGSGAVRDITQGALNAAQGVLEYLPGTKLAPKVRLGGAAKTAEQLAAEAEVAARVQQATTPEQVAGALGYKVRPSDVQAINPGEKIKGASAESAGDSAKIRRNYILDNQAVTTDRVTQDIGAPAGTKKMSAADFEELRTPHYVPYDEAKALPSLGALTPEGKAAIEGISPERGATAPAVEAIEKLKADYGTVHEPKDIVASIRKLRDQATKQIASDDPDVNVRGFAAKQLADAFEAELDRVAIAAGQPDLVDRLVASRRELAKNYTVEESMRAGQVDAAKLLKAQQRGAPLDGNMAAVAHVAEHFPNVVEHPLKFKTAPTTAAARVGGAALAGGTAGFGFGGPVGAAAGAAVGALGNEVVGAIGRSRVGKFSEGLYPDGPVANLRDAAPQFWREEPTPPPVPPVNPDVIPFTPTPPEPLGVAPYVPPGAPQPALSAAGAYAGDLSLADATMPVPQAASVAERMAGGLTLADELYPSLPQFPQPQGMAARLAPDTLAPGAVVPPAFAGGQELPSLQATLGDLVLAPEGAPIPTRPQWPAGIDPRGPLPEAGPMVAPPAGAAQEGFSLADILAPQVGTTTPPAPRPGLPFTDPNAATFDTSGLSLTDEAFPQRPNYSEPPVDLPLSDVLLNGTDLALEGPKPVAAAKPPRTLFDELTLADSPARQAPTELPQGGNLKNFPDRTVSKGAKVIENENGYIAYVERDGRRQIDSSYVKEGNRGKGIGKKLLMDLAEEADTAGQPLDSDVSVTYAQLRVYEALEKEGKLALKYSDPDAVKKVMEAKSGSAKGKDGGPVVTDIKPIKKPKLDPLAE